MAADFPRQKFEGTAAENWAQKVDQYVLGLEEEEVWREYTHTWQPDHDNSKATAGTHVNV